MEELKMRRGENASPDGASSPPDVHLSSVAFRSAQSGSAGSGNSIRKGPPLQLSELSLSGALSTVSSANVWTRPAEDAAASSGVCFDIQSSSSASCEESLKFGGGTADVAGILHAESKPVSHVRNTVAFSRMTARPATDVNSKTKHGAAGRDATAHRGELRRALNVGHLKPPLASKTWAIDTNDNGDSEVDWESLAASQSGLLQNRQFHGLSHPTFASAGLKAPPGLVSPSLSSCGFSGFSETPVPTRTNTAVDAERQCLDLLLGADLLSFGYLLSGCGDGVGENKFKIANHEGSGQSTTPLPAADATFFSSSREAPWNRTAPATPERTELPSSDSRMRQIVELLVSQIQSVVFGSLHIQGGRDGRRSRRKEQEAVMELSIIVGQLYTPWCTRKQILDPDLLDAGQIRRVTDSGTGHSHIVKQLQDLRSCVSGILLMSDHTEFAVTETGSLTCEVRGTVLLRPPISRPSESGGKTNASSSPSAVSTDHPPNRVGRFLQYLSLCPVGQAEASSSGAHAETGGSAIRALGGAGSTQFSFVVESETFALLADRLNAVCSPNWEVANSGAASHGANTIGSVSSTNIKAALAFPATRTPQSSRPILSVEPLGQSYLSDLSTISALFESFGLMRNAYSAQGVSDASAALGLSGDGGMYVDNVACMRKELLSKAESGVLQTERQPAFSIPFDVRDKLVRQQERKPKKTNRQRMDRRRQPLLTSKEMAALELHLQNLSVGCDRVQGISSTDPANIIPRGDTTADLCGELNGSGTSNAKDVTEVSVSRTIFVSWIPRAARADSLAWKDEREDTVRTCSEAELVMRAGKDSVVLAHGKGASTSRLFLLVECTFSQLKARLMTHLGVADIEHVRIFPPRGSHCCITFKDVHASDAFLAEYGGCTFDPKTEKFKQRICKCFDVEIDRGIQRVFIRIERFRCLPQAGRDGETANPARG